MPTAPLNIDVSAAFNNCALNTIASHYLLTAGKELPNDLFKVPTETDVSKLSSSEKAAQQLLQRFPNKEAFNSHFSALGDSAIAEQVLILGILFRAYAAKVLPKSKHIDKPRDPQMIQAGVTDGFLSNDLKKDIKAVIENFIADDFSEANITKKSQKAIYQILKDELPGLKEKIEGEGANKEAEIDLFCQQIAYRKCLGSLGYELDREPLCAVLDELGIIDYKIDTTNEETSTFDSNPEREGEPEFSATLNTDEGHYTYQVPDSDKAQAYQQALQAYNGQRAEVIETGTSDEKIAAALQDDKKPYLAAILPPGVLSADAKDLEDAGDTEGAKIVAGPNQAEMLVRCLDQQILKQKILQADIAKPQVVSAL